MTPEKSRRHIDVDEIQRRLTVSQLAGFYGFALPDSFSDGGEQRMRCPCTECGGHGDDRSVAINTSDPFKRWKCHRGEQYGCGAKGNLITLAYCLKRGRMPAGGKPTGREFYAIAEDLQALDSGAKSPAVGAAIAATTRRKDVEATVKQEPNVPLAESENAAARRLVDLDQQLLSDPAELSPEASAYARRHALSLSAALCRECRTDYMPGNSKSTLRGQWVYGVMNRQGQPLSWVGRNLRYEQDHEQWLAHGRQGQEPNKFRFPKQALFRRSLELYGQEWLGDKRFTASLQRYGLILVEGFNDRLNLHRLGVMSVAIMSNQITDEQTELAVRYAEEYAYGRIGIMYDADGKGDEGAKETLWRLHERGTDAYLVWSRKKFLGKYAGRQPESITDEAWDAIASGNLYA